jgi:hypothetical protein
MTISFSCPSCEHRLKVRDELAGRKVKCPSCGGGVVVPADEGDEAAVARPSREAREADEDERPRKKKKKKKTSNKGLVIGLAVGGVVLVAVTVLVIVLNLPKGQPNKEQVAENPPRKQEPVPQQPVPPPQPHPEQRVAGLANRGEDTAVMNDMKNIGLFYTDYCDTHRKGPPSSKAFADAIRRQAPHIAQAFDKELYVLLPGVRRGSNMVVAYDVPGNTAGQHIVLMGDGSVQAMPLQELQQHLKQASKQ